LEDIQAPVLADASGTEATADPKETGDAVPAADIGLQPGSKMNLGKVIAYLQQLHHSEFHADILRSENERLKRELNDVKAENKELSKKVEELENTSVTMQEDYETLMKILNRARKLVLFDEEERPSTTFKMDRNGNLEKLAE
jgi:prespore-specific regulator